MRNFLKKILLSVPFLTLLGITLLDTIWLALGRMPEIVRLLRDGVLLALLITLVPLYGKIPLFSERRIAHVLRTTFLFIVAGFLIFILSDQVFSGVSTGAVRGSRLHVSTRFFLIGTFATLAIILLSLGTLGLMRVLVLYKSRAGTLRNYRLLLIGILLFAMVSSAKKISLLPSADPFEAGVLGIASFCLLVVLVVVNSFRTSWIQFLNRGQKWSVFLFTAIASVLGWVMTMKVRQSFVADYSMAYAAIIGSIALFFAVYASLSGVLLFLSLPTAGVFDEKINAIKSLQELAQSISHFMEKDELTNLITQRALQVTKSDFAWLELIDERHDNLAMVSAVNLTEEEKATMPLSLAGGVSGWVFQNREGVLVNDTSDDFRTAEAQKWKKDLSAILAVPLISREQIFGILYSAKRDYYSYDQFDRDMLQSFANQAAIAFENARLLDVSVEKEKLAHELRLAHEAQAKLLPKAMPQVPGVDVAGVSIAAQEVGGDYYDVFRLRDKLVVIIGDVSGKGTAAAFYMAQVKGVMEALGRTYESPREVLIHANQIFGRSLEKNIFISLMYAVFDALENKMTLARAGHNPVLWFPAGAEPAFIQPQGLALGLDRSARFEAILEEIVLPLSPGDFFVFYTDGLVEARDGRNREFEERKLVSVLKKQKYTTAWSLKESILRSLRAHVGNTSAHDDFTLVVVGVADHEHETEAHVDQALESFAAVGEAA